jgi:hypothetical protein
MVQLLPVLVLAGAVPGIAYAVHRLRPRGGGADPWLPVASVTYADLCELADSEGWRVELYSFVGLLRLRVKDGAGVNLAAPVRFDPHAPDASAGRLLRRVEAARPSPDTDAR